MKIVVLGGTRFIGRAVVRELTAHGHELLVVHRGLHEADDVRPASHLHVHRREVASARETLAAFAPDGWVDLCAMTRDDAVLAVAAAPAGVRMVAISSQDVYRAFGSAIAGVETDPLPIAEDAPLRTTRLPDRDDSRIGWDYDPKAYEKIDVEAVYRAAGATVLRLPMTYGEHDPRRREEFVLRRLRAGRTRIPVGAATWLWSRGYVGDIARGVRLALESYDTAGETFNLCEARTCTIGAWMQQIARAAGREIELVHVPDARVPSDLELTRTCAQHLLFDASKARARLGWTETSPDEALARSVRWHLEHPPADASTDFSADDEALGAGTSSH